MSIDTGTPRTRRALLLGGLGGLTAVVASALGRPLQARASDPNDVVLGGNNYSTATTMIEMSQSSFATLYANSSSGHGIWGNSKYHYGVGGYSESNYGVLASSLAHSALAAESGATDNAAIYARSTGESTAVLAFSGKTWPLPPAPTKTGVYGYAVQDANARGVHGRSTAGRGVYGQATSGSGVYGYATTGYALRTSGRVRHDKVSGIATILKSTTTTLVTPGVDLSASSFVLLTPRANLGGRSLWYSVDTSADTFTIRISSAPTADLRVGWLLVG